MPKYGKPGEVSGNIRLIINTAEDIRKNGRDERNSLSLPFFQKTGQAQIREEFPEI